MQVRQQLSVALSVGRDWQQQIDEASIKSGKQMNTAETLRDRFIEVGFQNVHNDPYKVGYLHPINPTKGISYLAPSYEI